VTQPQMHMPAPHQLPRNGRGDASFALGLASLPSSWVPLLGLVAALTGVVLGLAGARQAATMGDIAGVPTLARPSR
jgi:hypothetical protein